MANSKTSSKQIVWSNDFTRLTEAELDSYRGDLAEYNRDTQDDTREPEDYTVAEVEEYITQLVEDHYGIITAELGL